MNLAHSSGIAKKDSKKKIVISMSKIHVEPRRDRDAGAGDGIGNRPWTRVHRSCVTVV